MEPFRLDGPASGPHNMEADLAMLESGGNAGRMYKWDGPWVSLGRFQQPSEALVTGWDRCVSRPTGGSAVLHGHDVTVSLVSPAASRKPAEIYRKMLQPVLEALAQSGLPCRLAGDEAALVRSQDCFASTDRFDVIDYSGVKVCGCALRMTRSAALLQMSIPYREPLVDPASAIAGGLRHPVRGWDVDRFRGLLCA